MKSLIATLTVLFLLLYGNNNDLKAQRNLPEFVDSFVSHQNNHRRYILHIPESYAGTQETALIVYLHGARGTSETAQSFTSFNKLSNDSGFLVVYPQGFFLDPSSKRFIWAAGRGLAADSLGIDDVGFIDKLVTTLKGQYKINAKMVYLCGFSNGGFLTQRIAFEKNQQFAAFGTLGGTMNESKYGNGDPGRAIPMMYVFGSADPLVPYNGGTAGAATTLPIAGIEKAISFWVANNNCKTTIPSVNLPDTNTLDNSTVTVYEYTNGKCNSKVKFYKVNGGGHTWPGINLSNQKTHGETNLDMFASQELWNFFKQFKLCQ